MLKIQKVEDLNQISANSITKSLDFSQKQKKSNFCKFKTFIEGGSKRNQLDKKTYGCLIGALTICDCEGELVATTGTVGRTTGWSRDAIVVVIGEEETDGVAIVLTTVATTVGGAGLDSECSAEPPVKSSCLAGVFAGKPDSSVTPSFFGGNSPPPPPPSPISTIFESPKGTQKVSFSTKLTQISSK